MNIQEFEQWFRGYFDASDGQFDAVDLERIIAKVKTITAEPLPGWWGFQPYSTGTEVCTDGGPHAYPEIWHGTIPPVCVKCGKSRGMGFSTTFAYNVQ